jgi:hypothetical protein
MSHAPPYKARDLTSGADIVGDHRAERVHTANDHQWARLTLGPRCPILGRVAFLFTEGLLRALRLSATKSVQ